MRKFVILGAGIQGTCIALALARKGHEVTLIENKTEPLLGASGVGEARIHLGFMYSNDKSYKTSHFMLNAGLHFAPLLEKYVGKKINWDFFCSYPTTYFVTKCSLNTTEEVVSCFADLEKEYLKEYKNKNLHYCGNNLGKLWKIIEPPVGVHKDFIETAIKTCEVALNPLALREFLKDIIYANPKIKLLTEHHVQNVSRTSQGFHVEGWRTQDGSTWNLEAETVINCLWDGRLEIDAQLGMSCPEQWIYRLKYSIYIELNEKLKKLASSYCFIVGAYGDIVLYPKTNLGYLSWYPTCKKAVSTELRPPDSWKVTTEQEKQTIFLETRQALSHIIPDLSLCKMTQIKEGVIFSCGNDKEDIDVKQSVLHKRDKIGIYQKDGYFSIDPGKYTCAPFFAEEFITKYI